MNRRIYVASSWRNPSQPDVVAALRAADHQVYDFRNPHLGPGKGRQGFHWSEIDPGWESWTPEQFRDALSHPVAREGFESDLQGMQWADTFVLVMPCGRSAHLELGWAIGAGKRSFILLSNGEPELMYSLAARLCTTLAELVREVE